METNSFMDLLQLVNLGGFIVLLIAFHRARKTTNEIIDALNALTMELLKIKLGKDKVKTVNSKEEFDKLMQEIQQKVRDDENS